MNNPRILLFKKLFLTLKEFKKTAYHHYGNSISSIPKFFYYSLFKINTFIAVGIDLNQKLPYLEIDSEFRIIKPDLDDLNRIRSGKNLPREFYYDKIHGVSTCYLALCGDEIACIHWIYLKGDYNRFLKLSPNIAELNYNTTLPKFRGNRLQTKMLCYILRELRENGFRKAVSVINKDNPPAIKGALRAGFKEMERTKTFGPFNRKIRV